MDLHFVIPDQNSAKNTMIFGDAQQMISNFSCKYCIFPHEKSLGVLENRLDIDYIRPIEHHNIGVARGWQS